MPNWTKAELREYEDRVARKICSPQPQPAVCHEPLDEASGKAQDAGRARVSITSCRRRLLDPDNLCCKYFIDGLRFANLIKGDRADQIELTFQQVKVQTRQEEETRIEIEL